MNGLPTHISRYEIKSRIARGGMGDLYLALDPNTNRLVALKLLNATLDSSELRERFAREARALAALNHPNIVNIYDTGEFQESPFIVMELVRGETLAEMIKRRASLSVPQKLKLMEELCAGLAQAHDAGIIHRDIKPANLMVDQQGRLKILDFGIARIAEGNRTYVGLPLTQVNMMIGTPGYMSPEQIEGGEVDHRTDIFAVGAVCYELLSYDAAFSGTNTMQIESLVMRGQPAPLASRVAGLDPEIDEIVLRALKRDPNKRYQDAATFERALERLRSRLGPDAPAPPQRPKPPPTQDQRGTSREARAEAAYQRALVAYKGGSFEAARRSSVEALAEDPSHPGARALLVRLEQRTRVGETKGTGVATDRCAADTGWSLSEEDATDHWSRIDHRTRPDSCVWTTDRISANDCGRSYRGASSFVLAADPRRMEQRVTEGEAARIASKARPRVVEQTRTCLDTLPPDNTRPWRCSPSLSPSRPS